jgi:feruloyl esterase
MSDFELRRYATNERGLLGQRDLRACLLFGSVVALCTILAACDSRSSATELNRVNSAPLSAFASQCHQLIATRLDSAVIEKAELVERGTQPVGFFKRMLGRVLFGEALPDLTAPVDFCRVTAKLRTVPGSEITAEVWLPPQWNGKLLAFGGAGYNGGLASAWLVLLAPLKKGYAGIATDAGHADTNSAKFTHDFPEQYTDYAYRANHVAAGFLRTLATSYYGAPVKRAYFHGCSNGGRDALMEARRFPEDYDGIIAGAPAAGWSRLMGSFAWNAQAVRAAPELKDKLQLVQNAAIAKCDALDGVKDQLIENPSACNFDPAELQCKGSAGSSCLTANEVTALRKIYEGPRLRDGTQVYAGMPVGGEGLKSNWDDWIVKEDSAQATFALETFRWMVYGDPKWELSRFDIDRDYPAAEERVASIMNSDDPDLSGFVGRGGKLLLYHGWNDAAIPAGATVNYYKSLRQALGSVADEHVRLFMVPGMMHCWGGVGPTHFDVIEQIDKWVDGGPAPERIVASEYDSPAILGPAPKAKLVRTRPLCAWPKVAHYKGSGSTDDAANFACE